MSSNIIIPQGIFTDQGSVSQTGGLPNKPHGSVKAIQRCDGSVLYSFNPLHNSKTFQGTWDNFYMLGGKWSDFSWAKYVETSYTFELPTLADIRACNGIEIDTQQLVKGTVYNMAWQWLFAGGNNQAVVSTFDFIRKIWVLQPVFVCSPEPGVKYVFKTKHVITGSGQVHISIMFNSIETVLGWSNELETNVFPQQTALTTAFQADSMGQGVPFNLIVSDAMLELK